MPPSTNLLIRASMALSVQACAPVKRVHMYMYVCVCASVGFCVYLPIIINCTLMSPKQDSGTSAGPRYSFSTRPRCQQSACIIMIDLFLTLPVVKPGYRIIPSCWTAAHCTVKTLEHNTHTNTHTHIHILTNEKSQTVHLNRHFFPLFVFCTFYCLFVPAFVSLFHSNLFFPQTNRWQEAICKTEQGDAFSKREGRETEGRQERRWKGGKEQGSVVRKIKDEKTEPRRNRVKLNLRKKRQR